MLSGGRRTVRLAVLSSGIALTSPLALMLSAEPASAQPRCHVVGSTKPRLQSLPAGAPSATSATEIIAVTIPHVVCTAEGGQRGKGRIAGINGGQAVTASGPGSRGPSVHLVGKLPFTGEDIVALSGLAAALVVSGAAVTAAARRPVAA